jgi:hypothetical protein
MLSVSEAMSILESMEQNLARLALPGYSRSNDGDETDDNLKGLQKWLDSLASLLVGASPGLRRILVPPFIELYRDHYL